MTAPHETYDTWILEGIEVKMTGRTAEKTLKAVGGKDPKVFVLYEVTPVDTFLGTWVKWCRVEDLFKVKTP